MHPIFQLILRDSYTKLPEVVRRFHEARIGSFEGRAEVKGSVSTMARLWRSLIGLPQPASESALTVRILRTESQERWLRQFNGAQFSSTLTRVRSQNLLCENFGLFSFYFTLRASSERIHWSMQRWSFLGIPMLDGLGPDISAWEGATPEGDYAFSVKVEFPLVGLLLDYSGTLVIPVRTEATQ
jgi:hypothetical protein